MEMDQQALAALNPSDGFEAEVPLQLHLHLFRAWALHALFVRSGENDQALLKDARWRRLHGARKSVPGSSLRASFRRR